ncbi:alkyl hydroperoxide reductase subunit F [Paraferrimonas haliotis]|uniref:alkyl hydroperoxide reductase subunit F n=1 Tax=Paraferrimonas haliotis TaxID=2013866 RepID=UPI000BA943BC|nr:alkyl hydroperoxide reductase subunit F [Paraferrimonas haliotis]
MLSAQILDNLKGYTAGLTHPVELVVKHGQHPKRDELVSFLEQVCSVSDKLSVRHDDIDQLSPISFALHVNNEATGIVFSGIPAGHEFNSLILALLHCGGHPIKLDDSLKNIIQAVDQPLHFETYISLSCHNCPDVVQTLNQFALLNPHITAEMIDGGLFQERVQQNNIQGVPCVMLNGELFANGKVEPAQLIEKLQAKFQLQSQQSEQALPIQDVTVVGGGPAGISAAIYAARKGLKVTVIADRIGGQLKDTQAIENLIGVSKTTGPELSQSLASHMSDYDITIKQHLSVTDIKNNDDKQLTLSSGEVIDTRSLILATGAKWRELGIPGEKENVGQGVAYCPHCDGPFFKGKDVAVIGGGNSGIEAALDLSGIVRSVTVFEFMSELKADKVLVEQAKKRDNIRIITNVACQQIIASNDQVSAIEFQHRDSGEVEQLPLSGVFVQIGLSPNSQLAEGLVELSPHNEIKINERGQTSATGIFACGDVTTVPYKQIVVAMGEGAKASLAAFEYLLTRD